MRLRPQVLAAAIAAVCTVGAAQAQDNVFKIGLTRYTTHSTTSGLNANPFIPTLAGSDAVSGDATTVILDYERTLTPNIGVELVIGVPPRIKSHATGPLAGLTAQLGVSNDILSAKIVAPTLIFNYYFGQPADTWRPYLGAGVNFTHFGSVQSSLSTSSLSMSNSWGPLIQAGVNYAATKEWGLFASIDRLWVKSDVSAVANIPGVPVPVSLTTTVDFRPVTYTFGAWYRF